jgi:hypothetical protein
MIEVRKGVKPHMVCAMPIFSPAYPHVLKVIEIAKKIPEPKIAPMK